LCDAAQVFSLWQQAQKQAAHARLLRELQLMHQAAMHHSKTLTQRTMYAWEEAVIVRKEEAAMQARKEQTWNKIHSWLAEDPGSHTNLNAITEPAFLQVRLHDSPTIMQSPCAAGGSCSCVCPVVICDATIPEADEP
jgi:hypothetical protein